MNIYDTWIPKIAPSERMRVDKVNLHPLPWQATSNEAPHDIIDIAWTAGIIDGEGCLSIHVLHSPRHGKVYESYQFELAVANTDLAVLDNLQRIWGVGKRYWSNKDKSVLANHKRAYLWIVYGWEATEIIRTVYECLVGKRVRADVWLGAIKHRPGKGRKTPIDDLVVLRRASAEMKRLNRRGK
jgi:hypothetical protein